MLDNTVGMDLKYFLYFAVCIVLLFLLGNVDDPLRDLDFCEFPYNVEHIELEPVMGDLYYIQD